MSRDYLVGHDALAPVLLEELGERDARNHHVGVLGTVVELRPDGRPTQEDNLEPEMLDPPQVGHDTRHCHQG